MNPESQPSERPLRVLIITKIFPNAVNEHAGTYNRQQFVALSRLCDVKVMGLIPWFPGAQLFSRKSEAGRLCAVPARERIDGLDVLHPRAFYFPRFGHAANPVTFALSLLPGRSRNKGPLGVFGAQLRTVTFQSFTYATASAWKSGRNLR